MRLHHFVVLDTTPPSPPPHPHSLSLSRRQQESGVAPICVSQAKAACAELSKLIDECDALETQAHGPSKVAVCVATMAFSGSGPGCSQLAASHQLHGDAGWTAARRRRAWAT